MSPSQKRLTRILLALTITGSLLIGGLWWDSTKYATTWKDTNIILISGFSAIQGFRSDDSFMALYGIKENFDRKETFHYLGTEEKSSYFSTLTIAPRSGYITLPYYLILLTYLATLFLAWLLLMNRIARREANKESHLINHPL